MKLSKHFLSLATVIVAATLSFTQSLSAQQIAYDDAGEYLLSANWTNGANQGFGYVPWVILTNGPDFNGNFINSGNNPAYVIASVTNVLSTNYTCIWGLYANGTNGANTTTAFRGFTNPLGTNTFKIQWGSTGAGNTSVNGSTVHGWCGFTLRNGNATNSASDFQSGVMMYFYFQDGNNPSTLYVWDGNSVWSIPGTSFSNLGRNNITNAIEAEITPSSDGISYHLVVKDCVQNAVLFTTNSIFISSGHSINSAALYCYEATGDQIYNRMQITSSTNLPPTISNLQPPDGSLYLAANTVAPSFEVDSFNSTLSHSTVAVYLNGVQQSGLVFNTLSPTNALLVSYSPAISPDTFYTTAIVATDANGNTVSNNYTFNTFLPGDIYIDAYDYNYNSGQFINNNTPINAFAGLNGSNTIDYQIADLAGTNNTAGYRSGDLVETLLLPVDSTGDPFDHANERTDGYTVYNVGFTDIGNWEDYTRVFPTTNYSIYARAASTAGGQFEVEKLANTTATTTNQPLIALGRVNVPNTGGSLVYSGQLSPVTDFYGNTVVVPLSGTTTLRQTALASRVYNLEYFAIVAVPGSATLRPYIATGLPAPNSTGVGLNTGISLSIANRQTSINTNSIQMFLNTSNVTSRLLLSSNAAGATISWTPTTNFVANSTNTVTVIFTDSSSTSVTNSWSFITGTSGGALGGGTWSGIGGPSDMFWADAINWTGGTPGPGFSASFASAGATTSLATNNIVAQNVSILQLNYETNNSGYNTTYIQDGITLTVTNGTTATGTQALQVGGAGGGTDNANSKPVTNTITGQNGTLLIEGNQLGSGAVNSLNIQVRQDAAVCPPRLVTLDMSGLGTFDAVVGKFYVAQGGSGANQTNVSGCAFLARTNVIYCIRPANAGTFEVADSSGGAFTLPGSALYFGITNSIYADSIRFGKQKATNNLICFNPAFTSITTPAIYIRDTNGPATYVSLWSIGDADTEATVPDYAQANVDFSGGKVDAQVNALILGRGETAATDSGYQQGTLTFSGGTMVVMNLTNGLQRANNTATETGVVNVNGTATLISTNIVLAQAAAGANATLVTGALNVTNGTVFGNITAGGGNSSVNLTGGSLIVSNFVGTTAARLATLTMANGTLHLKVNGSAPAANVNIAAISATASTITIDSVANISGSTLIHLISYTGADPYAGLSLAPLPLGYSGTLVDNAGSIDLSVNTAPIVSPTIRHFGIIGGQIVVSGTNNFGAGGTYHLLSSTNVALALTNWTVVTAGSFDGSGNFSSTNSIPTNNQEFYILEIP
ncbi:MAG TPA: hypothetical protein VGI03_14885 [Verrucomicrobiae bacterium]|jgi:hypothetical protein